MKKAMFCFLTLARIIELQKKNNTTNNDYQVDMDFSHNRGVFPPTTYVTTSAKPGLDVNKFEIIKERVLKFYFDNNKKVMYVDAIGYPDSVRYELRKSKR